MKKYFYLLLLLCPTIVDAQQDTITPPETLRYAEVAPEFPGGEQALMKHIQKELLYPEEARTNNIEGRVIVSFVVDTSGQLTDLKILSGPGYGTSEEVLRVMRQMPRWKPGYQNGKPVRVFYRLPVTFKLSKK